MDAGGVMLLALAVGAVLQLAVMYGPGMFLKSQFELLGNVVGKTRSEVEAIVGLPNAVTIAPDGKTICQWIRPAYHIALVFDGDKCEGISHVASV